ncbi:F-box-like protein [Ceratobasidium sp. AG-Ba]|nr:F-box-like protein [Ceratobasidium sp. AG-Ba]QRW10975.1 F-box-like protein [Ceratobasidium sp. AG-Ba]
MELPHSVTPLPIALTHRFPVQSALREWKDAKARLDNIIASYLAACSSLHTALLAHPTHRSFQAPALEESLTTIASELGSLADNEDALRSARRTLSELRNESTNMSPINRLPDDIIAAIFALAQHGCILKRGGEHAVDSFSAVSRRWREIALETEKLWNHIDIELGKSDRCARFGFTRLMLGRTTKNVHLHIVELAPMLQRNRLKESEIQEVLMVLTPHLNRTAHLDIESYSITSSLTQSLIDAWIRHCSSGTVRTLNARRTHASCTMITPDTEPGHIPFFPGSYENVLRSISTIRFKDIQFDWNSPIYHGLVELRLAFKVAKPSIELSQLTEIFSSSPLLVGVELKGVNVTHNDDSTTLTPINMQYLKNLDLTDIHTTCLPALLSLLTLSTPSARLGIPIESYEPEMQLALEQLLARSTIDTMCCSNKQHTPFPCQPALRSLSYVNTLFLEGCFIHVAAPHSARSSRPNSRLVLTNCTVTFESLKDLISRYSIQTIHLHTCRKPDTHTFINDTLDIQHMITELIEIYPNLKGWATDGPHLLDIE